MRNLIDDLARLLKSRRTVGHMLRFHKSTRGFGYGWVDLLSMHEASAMKQINYLSEGNKPLERCLQTCYKNGIKSVEACGHRNFICMAIDNEKQFSNFLAIFEKLKTLDIKGMVLFGESYFDKGKPLTFSCSLDDPERAEEFFDVISEGIDNQILSPNFSKRLKFEDLPGGPSSERFLTAAQKEEYEKGMLEKYGLEEFKLTQRTYMKQASKPQRNSIAEASMGTDTDVRQGSDIRSVLGNKNGVEFETTEIVRPKLPGE